MIVLYLYCCPHDESLQTTEVLHLLCRRAAHFANYAADDDEEALGALKDKAVSTCNSTFALLALFYCADPSFVFCRLGPWARGQVHGSS